MDEAGIEDDQAAALIISNWLRNRLTGEPDVERRIRRAADIVDLALWLISGPKWARSNAGTEPVVDDDPTGGARVVRLFPREIIPAMVAAGEIFKQISSYI